jgi:hypothetical protein
MAVISVTILESTEQIVKGIPKSVNISTNIPSNIFYTFDGEDPTLLSNIYVGTLLLPTDINPLTFKVWATNGVDSSVVVDLEYVTTNEFLKTPHAGTTEPSRESLKSNYPFGDTPKPNPDIQYLGIAAAGQTIYDPSMLSYPNAVDADGNPAQFTNEELNQQNYGLVYSTTDDQNVSKPGVGTMPTKVVNEPKKPIPPWSETTSKFFDPRAQVIYQDVDKEDPSNPSIINRQFFTLQTPEDRDGVFLNNTGFETPPLYGSLVRSSYNSINNTMTYYYRDSMTNRWIISKSTYYPKNPDFNYAGQFFSKSSSAGFVLTWLPFQRRVLF